MACSPAHMFVTSHHMFQLWYQFTSRDANSNRKWTDFTFISPSHNYIHIAKFIFSIRDE